MKCLWLMILALLLGACTIGSSTSERPALTRPAIGPDGTFWDAVTVASRRDNDAFLHLLSPQMIFRSLFPEARLREISSHEQFEDQREELEAALVQYAAVVQEFATRYMQELNKLVSNKFVEVGRPDYSIKYNDGFDRAEGPNTAKVVVQVYPKGDVEPGFKPEIIEVTFIQDGRRWLIHEFGNDKLKGAFVR